MMKFSSLFFLLYTLLCSYVYAKPLEWTPIDEGLHYLYIEEAFSNEESSDKAVSQNIKLHLVRIDPKSYAIHLYGTFLEEEVYTLPQWAEEKALLVAINASMYLPDNITSTGYMQNAEKINNRQIMQRMSGFLLSEPIDKTEEIPYIRILEKSEENWQETLKKYKVVVQNFRVIGNYRNGQSTPLWKQNEKRHPIALYGDDVDGNIYFIFSQLPLSVYDLSLYLLTLSQRGLKLKTLLYAEGGSEAGLFLNMAGEKHFFSTSVAGELFNFSFQIPNILGVYKRD